MRGEKALGKPPGWSQVLGGLFSGAGGLGRSDPALRPVAPSRFSVFAGGTGNEDQNWARFVVGPCFLLPVVLTGFSVFT